MRNWPSSAWSLVGANVWELVGVLVFGWDAFLLAFVYWAENVVIGLFNIPRMLLAERTHPGPLSLVVEKGVGTFFFIVHFGGFCLVHVVALNALWRHFGGGAGNLFDLLVPIARSWPLWAGILLLVLSHGHSFVLNSIGRGEATRVHVSEQMFAPYPRVLVMHVAVLAGAFVLVFTRMPRLFGALLVLLKVALDLRAHLRERARGITRAG